jgi:hypothetical protein
MSATNSSVVAAAAAAAAAGSSMLNTLKQVPPINIFTAALFVLITSVVTFALFKASTSGVPPNSKKSNDQDKGKDIGDEERVLMVTQCNLVEQELQALLGNQMVNINDDHKKMLLEKKHYVKKIKHMANDASFTSKKEFAKLHHILKAIQKDIKGQNVRIAHLEHTVHGGGHHQGGHHQGGHHQGGHGHQGGHQSEQLKNEVANMLIQRMVNDTSRQVLQAAPPQVQSMDEAVLEKYIIKTIRDEIGREMARYPVQAQTMNPTAAVELERKMQLMDLVNLKLQSMENLYRNLHSTNKKQILQTVRGPAHQSVQTYVAPGAASHAQHAQHAQHTLHLA